MRKTAGILTMFIFLMACGEAERTPSDVLPKEKMRDILLDMNLAETYAREQNFDTIPMPDAVRELKVKTFYVQILALHKITREEFMRSYNFYESHPDRLELIYKDMAEIVKRKREVIDSTERVKMEREQAGKNKTRRDSLFWPSPDSLKLILP